MRGRDQKGRRDALALLNQFVRGQTARPGEIGDLILLALRLGLRLGQDRVRESDLNDAMRAHGWKPAVRGETSVAMPGSIVDRFDQLATRRAP